MKIISYLYFLLLKLRYKFNIIWFDEIDKNKQYVIFPNHQALVDPQIVVSLIWQKIKISPVISETYYNMPIAKYFFKMMWAVPMWDLQKWTWSIDDVKNAFKNIEIWIKDKKNILLYPAWQLYSQWFEVIKWKKGAYNLVQILPENVEILVVKTTWLWGSMWSKAWEWETPNFLQTIFKAIFILIWNILFLVPKREVKIEILNFTQVLKNIKNINEFNQVLQDFYNKDWEEIIAYNPHFFFYNNVKNKSHPIIIKWSIAYLSKTSQVDENIIPKEVKEKIIWKICEMKNIEKPPLTPPYQGEDSPDSSLDKGRLGGVNLKSNLINDLFFDSLDAAEIKSFVQINFPWSSNPPITELKSIWDLCLMAIWKSSNTEKLKDCHWWEVKNPEKTLYDIIFQHSQKLWTDSSIVSLAKEIFSKNKSDSFVYDTIFWLQSKKVFLIKAYLIAGYIKKIEWKYIWIMLPSVSSASLIIFSTYLAWKIPVMLNWTVWETALLHCVKFANIDYVLTSKNFYDKVKTEGTEKIREKYLFLEDMLKNISIITKLKALFSSIIFSIPKIKSDDEAVLLFTSWSESLPKAVSLTHKNIISDILGALYHFPIAQKDILLWFLPPFHSFWFTINTIMPLISGLRMVYTPDPNDAKTIVEIIKHTGITAVTSTPTFLKMFLNIAKNDDLKSIKYAVVWAEKCPETLAENFSKYCPNWKILEWYGITECSPVISINPPSKAKLWSVWLPIFWSDIKILSLENKETLPPNKEWMIYFTGDNVFNWYLDTNLESPFDEIDSKKYYKTWDLWYLDNEGYLYITWRLKRFIKIAGEMISLPFIEWVLNKKYWSDIENKIAIEALEEKWNVKIVLFWVDNLNLNEVSSYLRENWVSNLVKISEIIKIDTIPVLWTGKIDYKILKGMISFEEKKMVYNFSNIEETIIKKISELSKINIWNISVESKFWEDIHLDSIDVWELSIFIKTNYKEVNNIVLKDIKTIKDLINLIHK